MKSVDSYQIDQKLNENGVGHYGQVLQETDIGAGCATEITSNIGSKQNETHLTEFDASFTNNLGITHSSTNEKFAASMLEENNEQINLPRELNHSNNQIVTTHRNNFDEYETKKREKTIIGTNANGTEIISGLCIIVSSSDTPMDLENGPSNTIYSTDDIKISEPLMQMIDRINMNGESIVLGISGGFRNLRISRETNSNLVISSVDSEKQAVISGITTLYGEYCRSSNIYPTYKNLFKMNEEKVSDLAAVNIILPSETILSPHINSELSSQIVPNLRRKTSPTAIIAGVKPENNEIISGIIDSKPPIMDEKETFSSDIAPIQVKIFSHY